MIWNPTNIAVLRILAQLDEPATVAEITHVLGLEHGAMFDDRVRNALNALHRNENMHDPTTGLPMPMAVPVGSKGRAKTWAITDLGRQATIWEEA